MWDIELFLMDARNRVPWFKERRKKINEIPFYEIHLQHHQGLEIDSQQYRKVNRELSIKNFFVI
jgi:hypothetical protein